MQINYNYILVVNKNYQYWYFTITIFGPIETTQNTGDWKDAKTCDGGLLANGGNYFQREDLVPLAKLSEAKAECKKGCDANTQCQYATLETMEDQTNGDKKWCNLHASACSIMDGGAGQLMYTKSNY